MIITPILEIFLRIFEACFALLNSVAFQMYEFEVTYGAILIACLIFVITISIFYKGGRTS